MPSPSSVRASRLTMASPVFTAMRTCRSSRGSRAFISRGARLGAGTSEVGPAAPAELEPERAGGGAGVADQHEPRAAGAAEALAGVVPGAASWTGFAFDHAGPFGLGASVWRCRAAPGRGVAGGPGGAG